MLCAQPLALLCLSVCITLVLLYGLLSILHDLCVVLIEFSRTLALRKLGLKWQAFPWRQSFFWLFGSLLGDFSGTLAGGIRLFVWDAGIK